VPTARLCQMAKPVRLPKRVVMVGSGPVPSAWAVVLKLFAIRTTSFPNMDRAVRVNAFPEARADETDPVVCFFEDSITGKGGNAVIDAFIRLRFGLGSRLPVIVFCQFKTLRQLERWELFRGNGKVGQVALRREATLIGVFTAMSKLSSYRPFAFQLILGPFEASSTVLGKSILIYDRLKGGLEMSSYPEKEIEPLAKALAEVGLFLELRGAGHPWSKLRKTLARLGSPGRKVSQEEISALRAALGGQLAEVMEVVRGMMPPR
jgi:hypothetical protein